MKKAAPAKESGLHNMHADYNHHHINDHRQFVIEQVLPLILSYASKSSTPSDDVIGGFAMNELAPVCAQRYRLPVAAKSATGCASPISKRSTSSTTPVRSFFSPAFYGGVVWEAFAPAGSLLPRSCTPAQRYRPSCASDAGSSSAKGAAPMRTTLSINPSKSHAAAWKARAFAALRADSSLAVRLRRYNLAMERARALEAEGGAQ